MDYQKCFNLLNLINLKQQKIIQIYFRVADKLMKILIYSIIALFLFNCKYRLLF